MQTWRGQRGVLACCHATNVGLTKLCFRAHRSALPCIIMLGDRQSSVVRAADSRSASRFCQNMVTTCLQSLRRNIMLERARSAPTFGSCCHRSYSFVTRESQAGARTFLRLEGHGNLQGIVSSTLVFPSPDHRSIYSIQCEGGVTSKMTPAGLEPAIPGSVGRCLIHWATRPSVRYARCVLILQVQRCQ